MKSFKVPASVKSKVDKSSPFNQWAKRLKVSTKWVADTDEKKDFLKNYEEAKFLNFMLEKEKKEKEALALAKAQHLQLIKSKQVEQEA